MQKIATWFALILTASSAPGATISVDHSCGGSATCNWDATWAIDGIGTNSVTVHVAARANMGIDDLGHFTFGSASVRVSFTGMILTPPGQPGYLEILSFANASGPDQAYAAAAECSTYPTYSGEVCSQDHVLFFDSLPGTVSYQAFAAAMSMPPELGIGSANADASFTIIANQLVTPAGGGAPVLVPVPIYDAFVPEPNSGFILGAGLGCVFLAFGLRHRLTVSKNSKTGGARG